MFSEYTSWVQLTITGALLAAFFVLIRANTNNMFKELKDKFAGKFIDYKNYHENQLRHTKDATDKELEHMKDSVNVAHDRINEGKQARENIRKEFLTEEKHALLCSNNTHEIKKHISEEIKRLSENLLAAIIGLEKQIARVQSRTHFLKDKKDQ